MTGLAPRRVSPFGHPRITACVPLPLAYRSLPRPSSPPCAQASPTCFRSLDYKILASSRARAIYELKSANCKSRRFKSHDHSIPTVVKQLRCSTTKFEIGTCQGVRLPCGLSVQPSRAIPTRRSGKEVIQPQVPLRLPCYDFAPVTTLAFGGLVPCGFRHRLRALVASMA